MRKASNMKVKCQNRDYTRGKRKDKTIISNNIRKIRENKLHAKSKIRLLHKRRNWENKKNDWKYGSRNYLKKGIENKVEKNLPERRVKRKRDGT